MTIRTAGKNIPKSCALPQSIIRNSTINSLLWCILCFNFSVRLTEKNYPHLLYVIKLSTEELLSLTVQYSFHIINLKCGICYCEQIGWFGV